MALLFASVLHQASHAPATCGTVLSGGYYINMDVSTRRAAFMNGWIPACVRRLPAFDANVWIGNELKMQDVFTHMTPMQLKLLVSMLKELSLMPKSYARQWFPWLSHMRAFSEVQNRTPGIYLILEDDISLNMRFVEDVIRLLPRETDVFQIQRLCRSLRKCPTVNIEPLTIYGFSCNEAGLNRLIAHSMDHPTASTHYFMSCSYDIPPCGTSFSLYGQCPGSCVKQSGLFCLRAPLRQDNRSFLGVGASGLSAYVVFHKGNTTEKMLEEMLREPQLFSPFDSLKGRNTFFLSDLPRSAFFFLTNNTSTVKHPHYKILRSTGGYAVKMSHFVTLLLIPILFVQGATELSTCSRVIRCIRRTLHVTTDASLMLF